MASGPQALDRLGRDPGLARTLATWPTETTRAALRFLAALDDPAP